MTAADAWVAADRIGRFELRRRLGQGAQASVWLAHDSRLGRDVALKLLRGSDDVFAAGQALDEARAVSRLAHPNILPLFEANEISGLPYLVFEFVDGPTLAEARRGQGALDARAAVTVMLNVLDALAVAPARRARPGVRAGARPARGLRLARRRCRQRRAAHHRRPRPGARRRPALCRRAGAFLLLPLAVKGATIGMIYADREQAGGIAIGEKELSLLRTLRNQAIMAIRQSERG